MIKRLIFQKKETCDEYIIKNKRGDMLGEIAYYKIKGHKKPDWWSFMNWHPFDGDRDFWIGEDCHREIADFIKELKDKTQPKEAQKR